MPTDRGFEKFVTSFWRNTGEAFDEALRERVEEVYKQYEPYWDAKAKLARTIVSLGSGVLVLTVTFVDSLIGNSEQIPYFGELLIATWAAIILSVASGVTSLGIGIVLKRDLWNFYYEQSTRKWSDPGEKVRKVLKKDYYDKGLSPVDAVQAGEQMADLAPSIIKVSSAGLQKLNLKDKNDYQLYAIYISLTSFVVGLALLGLLGAYQFAT